MQAEFEALEKKVDALIGLTKRLREENQQMRNELAARDVEARRLNDKITAARERLEAILTRLPEDE